MRALGGIKLASVGPGTADELAGYHLRVDLQPDDFRSESLAAALAKNARGKRFLLPRASRGREVLPDDLRAAGGIVDQIVVYHSLDLECPDSDVATRLAEGDVHWITVTSSAIARSLVQMFGDDLRQSRLASLSPITSNTLRELGFEPTIEANVHNMQGLIDALLTRQ
jgi:uroporphyrinogen III methyltransferase/synthase